MTFDELVERAVQEPTLAEALSFVATHENERAVAQAKRASETGISTATPGQQWDTCFLFLFKKVLEAWPRKGPGDPVLCPDCQEICELVNRHAEHRVTAAIERRKRQRERLDRASQRKDGM